MDYRRAQEELGFTIPQAQSIYNLPGIDATAKPDKDAIIRSEAATRAYKSTGIGAAAGSTLGGIAGTYFGPVGTAVGSAAGGALGSFAEEAMFKDG